MKTILVPTDFSTVSTNAVDYALGLAKRFGSKLILLHVDHQRKLSYAIYRISSLGDWEKAELSERPTAYERLRALRSELHQKHGGMAIDIFAETGPPYEVILRTAAEHNADLIVMGISAETERLKEHFTGSISVKVARNPYIPTFIIPQHVKYTGIQKISFACDLKKTEQTRLAHTAKSFSKAFDAELEVVNIEKPHAEISVAKSITNFFMEEMLGNIKHTTIHISGHDVAYELEDYFQIFKTDVLMLSPRRHNPWYHLFNQSITNQLVFHSGLPILAIH